jgi:hypothetical protein
MRRHSRLSALAPSLVALGLVACGDDDDGAPLPPADCQTASGPCETMACDPPELRGDHVEMCSPIDFHSNPPTSGPHYPFWAAYRVYDTPVPRGFYLHSIEHSAVVLTYNCDRVIEAGGDCAALIAQLVAFRDAFGRDDLCNEAVMNRILVTPDPLLDVPFAAAAWGHSLKAKCFDGELVASFADSYYGMNYENLCNDGTAMFPSGCGM